MLAYIEFLQTYRMQMMCARKSRLILKGILIRLHVVRSCIYSYLSFYTRQANRTNRIHERVLEVLSPIAVEWSIM